MSRLIAGQMRINSLAEQDAFRFLSHALEKGVNHFDHADIYGNGECERIFGRWLASGHIDREKVVIQSKCGICLNGGNTYYDNSGEYIIRSVDQILSRLNCGYLDNFLIHRPDALMDAEDIARAFTLLKEQGKVKHFGVSNFNPAQISYLKTALPMPVEFNQMQLSLAFAPMISEGLETNTYSSNGLSRSQGILDYCRASGISMQIWSPLQFGTFAGNFINHPDYRNLNNELQQTADRHQVAKSAVAVAWILKINPSMQVLSGTCNISHFDEMLQGTAIDLTREEWYRLYKAAGYSLP